MPNKRNGRPVQPVTPADCPLVKSTHKLQGLTKEMKDLLMNIKN